MIRTVIYWENIYSVEVTRVLLRVSRILFRFAAEITLLNASNIFGFDMFALGASLVDCFLSNRHVLWPRQQNRVLVSFHTETFEVWKPPIVQSDLQKCLKFLHHFLRDHFNFCQCYGLVTRIAKCVHVSPVLTWKDSYLGLHPDSISIRNSVMNLL